MGFIDKFTTIGDTLFGGIFAAILLAIVVLGVLVGRSTLRRWIAAMVLAVGIVGFYGWSTLFVFPYPPNAPPTTWMMAGWTMTKPASDYLATTQDVASYDVERRNSELVYAFEGDVQKVWEGQSMLLPKLIGQFLLSLTVFGLAWALTLLGVALVGSRPEEG